MQANIQHAQDHALKARMKQKREGEEAMEGKY
jgi:hypothetical protein